MHIHNSSFPYKSAEYEEIPCDLCGSTDQEVLGSSRADPARPVRSKTPQAFADALAHQTSNVARAVICRKCGLIFISPRMTREWYNRFYQEEYRAHGEDAENLDVRFQRQRKHGAALAEELKPYLLQGGLLVDVGSSTGGTLAGFKEVLGNINVLGIEPSEEEVSYANSQNIPSRAALIEDIENKGIVVPAADQILCTQSLNHFLSPKFFFKWAWQHLKPGGRLILEVKNFRQQARRSSRVENSIQIDHVYMFTPETVREYILAAGFKPIAFLHDEHLSIPAIRQRQRRGLPGFQIRVVAEKMNREPFSDVSKAVDLASYKKIKSSLAPWRLRVLYFLKYGGVKDTLRNRINRILGRS